ncbi:MAG: 16S rRNA (adenine(1518)-N(6)/adenine(1519)-N(6))-dimethyltransferase RsmA [Oscillospiraceae bacterium]|nr:16S rRNA (adenine(1518)-N(6)/adenine(1519)-N(6))-dimethyltransferase RsmA [Oscillospiraceae bacterium]
MGENQSGAWFVRDLLDRHGFKFSKALGQNFLIDANIPEKIVRLSGIDETCTVVEVGPGIGALTMQLCRASGKVIAVELDDRLLPILSDTLAKYKNVEVVSGDILKLDMNKLIGARFDGLRYAVCANLPYNITSPALITLINTNIFEQLTVMVQREVAWRMCATPGSADYSAFSVFINYHTEPEILFDVPPECFMPRPKVHSSVVMLKTRKERLLPPEEESRFFKVVRAAFGQRRKTLANALHAAFGSVMTKSDIIDAIEKCGFDPRIRGETLGIESFIKLAEYF